MPERSSLKEKEFQRFQSIALSFERQAFRVIRACGRGHRLPFGIQEAETGTGKMAQLVKR